ncbi:hypothetical protein JIG36_11130 [Actinoplanes sp. LDG1-06]|uniref:Major facilitator superfamily (MFS) profile domain-containing protein n=1 Tax=Paractinoplanes ovalisporus TaxID=2810368 RepID=A0ABS2A8D6_9ACTN|nr:hypothetical protein [Actinoplanes ovalisporus]MBM2616109.1 hypothetical protein [Actinoplanes ovalisporus]
MGTKRLLSGGIGVTLAGTLVLGLIQASSGYLVVVLPAMVLTGAGLGLFLVALPNAALAGIDSADTGVASAMISATQQVGGAIGPELLNTLYVSAVVGHSGVHGYRVAFLGGAALFVLALVAAGLLIRSRRAAGSAEPAD